LGHSLNDLILLRAGGVGCSAEDCKIVHKSLFCLEPVEESDKQYADEPDCTHESAEKGKRTNESSVEVDGLGDRVGGQYQVESLVSVVGAGWGSLLVDVVSCHGEHGVLALVSVVIKFFALGGLSVIRVGESVGSHVGDEALHLHVHRDLSVVQKALGEVGNTVVLHVITEARCLVVINVELRGEHLELGRDNETRWNLSRC